LNLSDKKETKKKKGTETSKDRKKNQQRNLE